VIPISDDSIDRLDESSILPPHQIGEIIVRSRSVTREYFQRPDATALAKIADPPGSATWWHRMGDVGYFDDAGRLWFCGRKAHLVETAGGTMFPVRCEAIINEHQEVYRSALVGVGKRPDQRPVIIVEPEEESFPNSTQNRQRLEREILDRAAGHDMTAPIQTVLFHRSLPVDPRHNVKINRERLAVWASEQLQQL
jgi:acyl-CoA synthetase (AMP-forming)/AMP-acid ligase II